MDEQKIQEIQILEQTLQNLFLQKQAFQMELSETESALQALETSGEEVFKIIGQLMLKSEKPKIKGELEDKKKLLELRIKTMDSQETSLTEQLDKVREELMNSSKK